ncbi:hypothetical protein C8R46DRAFT_1210120 [Mycena filopes]|nr:hypothetical protein C8R46DRAFT_1210120 [Mycena filopes]
MEQNLLTVFVLVDCPTFDAGTIRLPQCDSIWLDLERGGGRSDSRQVNNRGIASASPPSSYSPSALINHSIRLFAPSSNPDVASNALPAHTSTSHSAPVPFHLPPPLRVLAHGRLVVVLMSPASRFSPLYPSARYIDVYSLFTTTAGTVLYLCSRSTHYFKRCAHPSNGPPKVPPGSIMSTNPPSCPNPRARTSSWCSPLMPLASTSSSEQLSSSTAWVRGAGVQMSKPKRPRVPSTQNPRRILMQTSPIRRSPSSCALCPSFFARPAAHPKVIRVKPPCNPATIIHTSFSISRTLTLDLASFLARPAVVLAAPALRD